MFYIYLLVVVLALRSLMALINAALDALSDAPVCVKIRKEWR